VNSESGLKFPSPIEYLMRKFAKSRVGKLCAESSRKFWVE